MGFFFLVYCIILFVIIILKDNVTTNLLLHTRVIKEKKGSSCSLFCFVFLNRGLELFVIYEIKMEKMFQKK